MGDLWESLNDEVVPEYFKDISKKYGFQIVKLNKVTTGLVKEKFAIMIGLDRYYAGVAYVTRYPDGILKRYYCDNYFSEKFDALDRQGLEDGGGATNSIKNSLTVISRGLVSKWENVLLGDTKWIDDLEKKDPNCIGVVTLPEKEILEKMIH